jgi:hypothetical protein
MALFLNGEDFRNPRVTVNANRGSGRGKLSHHCSGGPLSPKEILEPTYPLIRKPPRSQVLNLREGSMPYREPIKL